MLKTAAPPYTHTHTCSFVSRKGCCLTPPTLHASVGRGRMLDRLAEIKGKDVAVDVDVRGSPQPRCLCCLVMVGGVRTDNCSLSGPLMSAASSFGCVVASKREWVHVNANAKRTRASRGAGRWLTSARVCVCLFGSRSVAAQPASRGQSSWSSSSKTSRTCSWTSPTLSSYCVRMGGE